jgi:hypothetical protein
MQTGGGTLGAFLQRESSLAFPREPVHAASRSRSGGARPQKGAGGDPPHGLADPGGQPPTLSVKAARLNGPK